MVKIPTITSKARITAEGPSVAGGTIINPKENLATATASVTSGLTQYYVNEKKQEAANNATKILSSLYTDADDGTLGFYSINSVTSSNPNPSEASEYFDNEIEKLWKYTQNTKLINADNFLKKAIESKFYSTASLFKIKSMENSRNEQIKETTKITNDFILKDSLALKTNGIGYLDAFNNNVKDQVNKQFITEAGLDEGVKKKAIDSYTNFGHKQLANDLAIKDPFFLKENINKFTALTNEDKATALATADKQIFENKKIFFTSELDLTEDSTAESVFENFDEIKNGTFNGDIDKINLWLATPENEKRQIIDFARTKRSQNTAEINNRYTATLNQNKDKAINNYQKILQDTNTLETISLLQINEVFGEPKNDYELNAKNQLIELATTIGEKELANVNNFEKNFDIQKAILSGQITDHVTPFQLEGETELLSIVQRVNNNQISKSELGFYVNYLLPNVKNSEFRENHIALYKTIESIIPYIRGPESFQHIDTTLDNRLNNFKSQMLANFTTALRDGKKINEILDIKNKNFLIKNLNDYKPDKDLLTKILSESESESVDINLLMPPKWNPDKHKTYEDYINSEEYKEYLKKKEQ